VHLPLMDFGDPRWSVDRLVEYVETATALGFEAVSANDHMIFATPWLDGPTALASVVAASGDARLVTTVANPVTRGPVALAKTLAALDQLSGGRVTGGLGPGSSARAYASVGVPFDERWPRFDDAVRAMRALLGPEHSDGPGYEGRYYSCPEPLEPPPAGPDGLPLWVASWGSPAGLRRAARLGDGWLASAYNTTPAVFGGAWTRVRDQLAHDGRSSAGFENGLATMWFHIDQHRADAVLESRLASRIHRSVDELRERLAFGSAARVQHLVASYEQAGLQWMFVWPVADELEQLHRFHDEVMVAFGS
jgi:alkanesulfonate monooxygenase SsuD/methylene tetrahydromethanopterin reductase-like flavin-dependent oxidoreductase (luciferase family)